MLGVVGCGKKDEKSHIGGPAPVILSQKTPAPVVLEEKKILSNVIYSTACRKYVSRFAGAQFSSMKVSYIESGSAFERTQFLYSTDDCLSDSLIITERGTFSGVELSDKPEKIRTHDFLINSVTITVTNNLLVTLFNQEKLCAIENWEWSKAMPIGKEANEVQCLAKAPIRSERAVFMIPDQKMFYVKAGSDNSVKDRKFNIQKDTSFFRE